MDPITVTGQVTADISEIVNPLRMEVAALRARVERIESGSSSTSENADTDSATPDSSVSASDLVDQPIRVEAPAEVEVGETLNITVHNADRVWVRVDLDGQPDRIIDTLGEELGDTYTLTLTPDAPGRIRIDPEPGTDSPLALNVEVIGEAVAPPVVATPTPTGDNTIIVEPGESIARAYARLRSGEPGALLFRAGQTYEGNLGVLDKSGRSADEPIVIGAIGEGPRPVIMAEGNDWANKPFNGRADYVTFRGLHIVHPERRRAIENGSTDGLTPEAWRAQGIVILGGAKNITIEDCKIVAFRFGIVLQSSILRFDPITDAVIRSNIVIDSFGHHDGAIAGHSSGILTERVHGLLIEGNVFDHNGWAAGVAGANRTQFNHNIYVQSDCLDVTIRGNVITRGSSFGVQVRPGGMVENNLLVGNPLAMYVGRYASVVRRNVVLHGINQDGGGTFGIGVNPCLGAVVRNNIVSQKAGNYQHGAALHADWTAPGVRWLDGREFVVSFINNKIYQWRPYVTDKPHEAQRVDELGPLSMRINRAASINMLEGNEADNPDWIDPGRDVASYMATLGETATLDAYLDKARTRERGETAETYSAPAVNDYIREGFESR